MALSAPLLSRLRLMQVKVEAEKGTLIAVDTDVLVYDVACNPEEGFNPRKGSAKGMGHTSPGILDGSRAAKCTFKTELRGTGGQALDAGLAILLQACGQLKTTEVYTFTSTHASQNTISIAWFENGRRKQLAGCMGTYSITPENGVLFLSFEFSGVWQAPTDTAMPTCAYSVRAPIPWGHSSYAFTLAAQAFKMTTFTFACGNEVVPRFDGGRIAYYMITDRDPKWTLDPEADLIAGYDTYGSWLAGTELALSLAVTDGTDTVTLASPKTQISEPPATEDSEGILRDVLTLQCNISVIDTGDDEFSLAVT